jgi:hypothetical protein
MPRRTQPTAIVAGVLLGALLGAAVAAAQESRGSITGTVTDTSGAVVPGATIVATRAATNLTVTATADAQGNYSLLYLPAGEYTVTAELTGFKKTGWAVEVRVGDRLVVNLKLEPGGVAELVEVVAGSPLLETASGSSGQVVDAQRINLLPLSDGNPFVLSRLAPGAAYTGDLKFSRPFDNAGTSSITVDGASGGNEFTLDGSPNMAHGRRVAYVPPTDAVEEFKVETASYDAQHGHTAGGNINVVMKGGTNAFHGTVYEFYRSDSLSANDFFLNRAEKPRAPLDYNRFGASINGPIIKDKTFFAVTYEGIFDEFPEPGQFTVPTEAQRQGDFSALLAQGIQIYNPYTARLGPDGRVVRDPFPGNIIPASMLDPIALNYLDYYPLPNQAGDAQGRNNYIGPNGRGDDFHAISARIDHRWATAHRSYLRFVWNDRVENRGNWTEELNGIRPTGNYLFRVNWGINYDHVWTISSNTLLNVRGGFSRFEEPSKRQHQDLFDPSSLGWPSGTTQYFGDNQYYPRFEINGMSVLGDTFSGGRYTNIYSLQPTLSKVSGRHSLRFGYDFRIYQDTSDPSVHSAGRYDFNADYTRQRENSPSQFGQGLAAFMLGQPTGGLIDRSADRRNQQYYNGLFVQDDWRVTDRLTLNLGLRYDYETAGTEEQNRNVQTFQTTISNPIEAEAQANYAQKPIPEVPVSSFQVPGGYSFVSDSNRAMWEMDKNNIQPRVGFAYKVGEKTVVRGGWGVFTVPILLETFNQSGFSQATNLVPTVDRGLSFQADLSDPFPFGVAEPPGASLGAETFLGRDIGFIPSGTRKNDQSMRWSIGFQRELFGNWVLEAAYVGNRGYDLTVAQARTTTSNGTDTPDINPIPAQYLSTSPTRDQATINYLNQAVPNPFFGLIPGVSLGTSSTTQRQQLLRPLPSFLTVRGERTDGTSSYHSAQVRLERRFARGWTLTLAYTWSRFEEKRYLLNATDPALTEYLSTADVPHRFVAHWVWELPFGKGRHFEMDGFANALLGGWSFQGIFNWQSGRPFAFGNLHYDGDPSKLETSWDDPDHIFDTSGFYINDSLTQTNGQPDPAKQRADSRIRLDRNIRYFPLIPGMRSQPFMLADLSFIKTIDLPRDMRLQLRFEAINAFNTAVFNNPTVDPTSADFGKSTSQFNIPRNFQLAVKFIF